MWTSKAKKRKCVVILRFIFPCNFLGGGVVIFKTNIVCCMVLLAQLMINWETLILENLNISCFLKFLFTPPHFYERLILVPVSATWKKFKEDFHFYEKVKSKNSVMCPKVITSSLCTISAFKRFHGNALLSGHVWYLHCFLIFWYINLWIDAQ